MPNNQMIANEQIWAGSTVGSPSTFTPTQQAYNGNLSAANLNAPSPQMPISSGTTMYPTGMEKDMTTTSGVGDTSGVVTPEASISDVYSKQKGKGLSEGQSYQEAEFAQAVEEGVASGEKFRKSLRKAARQDVKDDRAHRKELLASGEISRKEFRQLRRKQRKERKKAGKAVARGTGTTFGEMSAAAGASLYQ